MLVDEARPLDQDEAIPDAVRVRPRGTGQDDAAG